MRENTLVEQSRGGRGRRRGRGRGVPPASGARQRDHDSSGSDTAAAPVPDHAQVPDRQPVSLPDFPRAAWQWLDGLDLLAELRRQVPTLHTVPRFLAAGVRHALVSALQAIRVAHEGRDDVACVRAWKLFLLLPRLLLARCVETGGEGRAVLLRRVQLFREGRWDSLHGQLGAVPSRTRQPTTPDASEARAAAACARVRRGELSRARQVLTAAALAPGDEATLRALTDPSRRPPQPLRPVPQHVMNHHPAEEVALSKQQVADALRTSKRGSAAGLSGATVEFYKLLLDDEGALEAFTFVVNVAARAQAPPVALDALALSRLTALRKPQGGVRGIATGDVFRRLVSRALARAYAGELDEATRPFQFALRTRAGTDSLAAMLRSAVEFDPRATVVSLDGRSAYDTISRAAILSKLSEVVPALLPFARAIYARTSTFLWWDDEGTLHEISQAEGIEQGDPLAPGLYALGQHESLVAAAARLAQGERLLAFLDDLYVVTTPERSGHLGGVVAGEVERGAGVAANLGKTQIYNAQGGAAPPDVAALGPDVWRGDLPPEQRGFVALGVPIGHPDFVASQAEERLRAEAELLRRLPLLPDLRLLRVAPGAAFAPQRPARPHPPLCPGPR
ncbi:unnamed protein product [Symbiodinium natans]|uniref:Reverse transcriptase domain-containing protein n=1 Tax=Symbiodinium natans TaxID=878477 RepID=A0A812UIA4_9DINO|nr:unnamed protein product [Symbiodinium natans]